ncbi:hypothetical protein H6P81_007853 [Aristolochia fimbriata]|uniref:VQ domain-containing protein n=1 Tax=Aristolochia fimbriata TaxID=158543 RepID=A0AAV7F224_ARIFI|nr:hypothetical protein H6P81_007853 [Aristolochia fimbriata]
MELERSAAVLEMGKKKKPTSSSRRKKGSGIKVVYISNPMKVKASASEFRALVQELTGQDSDPAEMMAKLLAADSSSSSSYSPPSLLPPPPPPPSHHHTNDEDDDEPPAQNNNYCQRPSTAASAPGPVVLAAQPSAVDVVVGAEAYVNCPNFESTSLDDLFAPQMVETFNGFFPSSLFYESQMEMLRSLDAVI